MHKRNAQAQRKILKRQYILLNHTLIEVVQLKRRTFITASGATLASVLFSRFGSAQPVNRAAIVIGVDRAGTLPVLRAAASGASAFADWLDGEGFEVNRFIDKPYKPIKIDPIFEAVDRVVNRGVYEQLVIYFSGHGFLNSSSELWMLSGAPNNPNQAISLMECKRLCKRTGIPNVVFISDACRSTATSLAANSVRGSVIFPATANAGNVRTKIDIFLATQEGNPAYEVGVDKAFSNFQGIYTESFLSAFKAPEDHMVSKVNGVEVVRNKHLEDWLSRDVNRRAQLASLSIEQRPDTEVLSDKYIGRVNRSSQAAISLPPSEPTINEVAALAFIEKGFGALTVPLTMKARTTIRRSDKVRAFEEAQHKIAEAEQSAPNSYETQTGFFVFGIGIAEVIINPDFFRPEKAAEKSPGAIRLYPQNSVPASAAIRFSDGSGTVVAALRGYIGTIVVDEGRVVSVTYTRSGMGQQQRRLNELRSIVATSARFGTFSISGRGLDLQQQAEKLADRIRVLKGIDPTLGVYAAYAYDDADLPDQIESVRKFMKRDIRGEIFDVALLANALAGVPPQNRIGIAPFCPMLTQGWGLLRIANVLLPPEIDAARDHIEPALWTTFRPKGMDIITDAISHQVVV